MDNKYDVIVIGGGPAGMMAGISAARSGNEVVILEKMNMFGRKLLITGKGRCNITSSLDMSEFIQNIPGNGRFLFSCFEQFTNKDIIDLMNKHGVKVKEERGNRIFPVSDKSLDVLNAFLNELKKLKGAKTRKVLESYSEQFLDKNMYMCLTLTNAFYALWSMDKTTIAHYGNEYLIFTVPIVLLITMKYSMNIEGDSDGDPVEVLIHDKILILLCLVFIITMFAILYLK